MKPSLQFQNIRWNKRASLNRTLGFPARSEGGDGDEFCAHHQRGDMENRTLSILLWWKCYKFINGEYYGGGGSGGDGDDDKLDVA